MNFRGVLIVLGTTLALATGVACWFVLYHGGENADEAKPNYADVKTAEQLLARELARFKKMKLEGTPSWLHPKSQAILERVTDETTMDQFALSVRDQIFVEHLKAAEAFRDRHPEIWKRVSNKSSVDGHEFDTPDTASLPFALGTDVACKSAWDHRVCRLYLRDKEEDPDPMAHALPPAETDTQRADYKEFLALTDGLEARLSTALKKKRIIHVLAAGGLDPLDALGFPLPDYWVPLMCARVHMQRALGKKNEALTLTRGLFDLVKRLDTGGSGIAAMMMSVWQICVMRYAIVPSAQYGLFSADELEKVYSEGRSINPHLGCVYALSTSLEILQFLGKNWASKPEMGTSGFVRQCIERHGPRCLDEYFELEANALEARISKFETILPKLMGEQYPLDSDADYKAFVSDLETCCRPITLHDKKYVAVTAAYVAHALWVELKLRVEELRRERTFIYFEDEAKALFAKEPVFSVDFQRFEIGIMTKPAHWATLGIENTSADDFGKIRMLRYFQWLQD